MYGSNSECKRVKALYWDWSPDDESEDRDPVMGLCWVAAFTHDSIINSGYIITISENSMVLSQIELP